MEEEGNVFDDPQQERHLVIIGKTGNGKSSVGNLLLGKTHFRVGFSMTSTTVCTASASALFHNWKIKVLDTPDISNMGMSDEDEAQREVSTWKALMSPHAHAILLAVRCDVRYTREEHEIFLQLKKLWGGKSLSRRLIVVFTFGDRQDRDIQEDLKVVCSELKQVLKEASGRYIVFNDKDTPEGKQGQVMGLLNMVDALEAEVTRDEERRLLTEIQVCPMGPSGLHYLSCPTLQRSLSGRSSGSRGSSTTDVDYIKLVLVGKPGTGKSSTGNTILGRAAFPMHHNSQMGMHSSSLEEVELNGQRVQVVDTPGLQIFPGDKDYQQERLKASELIMPGPHALLFVVRHHEVTHEDLEGFRAFKETLGQGLSHHTIVVLVGVPRTSAASSASQQLEVSQLEEGEVFPVLLQEAGNKLWMVSNVEVETDARKRQVDALMALVRAILDNAGRHYFHGDRVARELRQKRDKDKAQRSSCWFL